MTQTQMQDRLIDFAVSVSEIVESLPKKRYANYLGGQVERSGTSPALNYGEACAAESDKDLLHKDKIILKELRETFIALRIIRRKKFAIDEKLIPVLTENNQLIAMFVKACQSVENRIRSKKK